jgi:glycosyltransferase involved in cell wall biosynthesis
MIVQVGPFPGPLGGVSVYVKRMKDYLDRAGVANQVWDIGAAPAADPPPGVFPAAIRRVPWQLLLRKDVRLIHYHLYTRRSKIYIGYCNAAFCRDRSKFLTLHGEARRMFGAADRALRRALNSFDAILCVRPGDGAYLAAQGVTAAIHQIPAFIPPRPDEPQPPPAPEIRDFLVRHPFMISANASALRFHDGADLYGVDLCIELTARLRRERPGLGVGCLFGLAEVREEGYLRRLRERIAALGIGADFLLVQGGAEFYPLIQKSQLFIRPTNTDGYSLSLAEALFFRVPALASDAAQRPPGTLLFRSRDPDDLYRQAARVMLEYASYRARAQSFVPPDYAGTILQLYQDALPKPAREARAVSRQALR